MHRLKKLGKSAGLMAALAALLIAVAPTPQSANAVINRADWNSLADTETQEIITNSTMREVIEYDDYLYAAGFRYDVADEEQALLYRFSPETGWQNALPDALDDQDIELRAMEVYNDELYISGYFRGSGEAEIWIFNGTTWRQDGKFTMNNVDASVSSVFDFTVTQNNTLCATGEDGSEDFSLIVMCTAGGDPWEKLTADGFTSFDYNDWRNNHIVSVGNYIYIQSTETSDGTSFSRVFQYNLEGSVAWAQRNVDGFDGNDVIKAMTSYNGNIYAVTDDSNSYEDVSVYRYNNTSTSWTKIGATNLGLTGSVDNPSGIYAYNGNLIVSVRNGDMLRLMSWNGSAWSEVGPLASAIGEGQPLAISYAAALTTYRDALIVGGTNDGEGFYNSSIWSSHVLEAYDDEDEDDGETPAGPDADDDGITDAAEDAAPNNGDANSDGTADSEQAYVSSFVSPISNGYVALAVPDECTIITAQVASTAANATKDSGFSYPLGMMDFKVSCGDPGYTATVTQFYYGAAGNYVARKYQPANNAYLTIPNAQISKVTIDGKTVTKVTYQVTDGSVLDDDRTQNGVIVDPAGLGVTAVAAPNTGLGGRANR
jgi:hypothetical protein